MYNVIQTKTYYKSLKKFIQNNRTSKALITLNEAIKYLSAGKEVDGSFRNHSMRNKRERECHIQSDVLLVYQFDHSNRNLILIDIGSHNQIFKDNTRRK